MTKTLALTLLGCALSSTPALAQSAEKYDHARPHPAGGYPQQSVACKENPGFGGIAYYRHTDDIVHGVELDRIECRNASWVYVLDGKEYSTYLELWKAGGGENPRWSVGIRRRQ